MWLPANISLGDLEAPAEAEKEISTRQSKGEVKEPSIQTTVPGETDPSHFLLLYLWFYVMSETGGCQLAPAVQVACGSVL